MEVIEVDPDQLEIDELNERQSGVSAEQDEGSLEDSIREHGLLQPPVVRENGDGRYKVVVGQRRILAAQAVGLEEIPAIKMDLDDADALQASISENVYRRDVPHTDRAAAVKKLIEITGWEIPELAEELSVKANTVRKWLERTNDEWEGTTVHVNPSEDSGEEQTQVADSISDTDLQTIRRATDSTEERERVVRKVAEKGLARREIREAKKQSENSEQTFEESIETVSKQRTEQEDQGIKVRTEITFAGDDAEALRKAAKDIGTSEQGVIRDAIRTYLKSEGYI